MRRYLLAAVAAAAIATPALARDGSPYVGIEAGILIPEDFDFDVALSDGTNTTFYRNALLVNAKRGYDSDVLAGYDFGFFRLEGELAYKHFKNTSAQLAVPTLTATRLGLVDSRYPVSSKGSILSLMGNALVDFGDENGFSGYVGLGAGRARVRTLGDRDNALAAQIIGGVRYAVTPNVDIGLKYRYFRTGKVHFNDALVNGTSTYGLALRDKVKTHSLLATLTYNFYTPAAPVPVVVAPPPPPPAPATQTCYDGSVILATDVCPQPPAPPPPPPPEPAPERG